MNTRTLSGRLGLLMLLSGLAAGLNSQVVSAQISDHEITATAFEEGKFQPEVVNIEVETFGQVRFNTSLASSDNQELVEDELSFTIRASEYSEGQAVISLPREYAGLAFTLSRFSLISRAPASFVNIELTGYAQNGRPVMPVFATNNEDIGISRNRLELGRLTSDVVLVVFSHPVSKFRLQVSGAPQGGQFRCALEGLLSLDEASLAVAFREGL